MYSSAYIMLSIQQLQPLSPSNLQFPQNLKKYLKQLQVNNIYGNTRIAVFNLMLLQERPAVFQNITKKYLTI